MGVIELVVLDMAGTTIEQGDEVALAFGSALQGSGIPFTEEEVRERMGASKREVIGSFVERHLGRNAQSARMVESAHSDFERTLIEFYAGGGAHPIRGAESAFAWLRERGISIALTTGFGRGVKDAALEAVGWEECTVDASLCGDDVPRGRPAPFMIFRAMESTGVIDVGRVVVVGDTVLDLQAAANAGTRGIVGVLSGNHGVGQLGRARHTHILPSVAELPALIESGSV